MPNVWVWAAALGVALVASAAGGAVVAYWRRRAAPTKPLREFGSMTDDASVVGGRDGIWIVVGGALLGHATLSLWPRWPPLDGLDRFLTIVAPAAALVCLLGGPLDALNWRRAVGSWLIACSFCRVLLDRSSYLQESAMVAWGMIVAGGGLLVAAHHGADRLSVRASSPVVALAVAAALLVVGALVPMAGYIRGGAAAIPWAGAVAGISIWSLMGRSRGLRADLRGVIKLSIIVLFGVVFIGRYFGRLSTATAIAVLLAPLGGWIAESPLLRRYPPLTKDVARLVVVGLILLAAFLAAKQEFDRGVAPLLGIDTR